MSYVGMSVDKAGEIIELLKHQDWRSHQEFLPMNIEGVYDYYRRGGL